MCCFVYSARTFGPALVNSFNGVKVWQGSYWIYFAGPFAASVAAAAIYKFLFAEELDDAPVAEAVAEPTKEADEGKGSGSDHV